MENKMKKSQIVLLLSLTAALTACLTLFCFRISNRVSDLLIFYDDTVQSIDGKETLIKVFNQFKKDSKISFFDLRGQNINNYTISIHRVDKSKEKLSFVFTFRSEIKNNRLPIILGGDYVYVYDNKLHKIIESYQTK